MTVSLSAFLLWLSSVHCKTALPHARRPLPSPARKRQLNLTARHRSPHERHRPPRLHQHDAIIRVHVAQQKPAGRQPSQRLPEIVANFRSMAAQRNPIEQAL
jgi:hypothetical protein